MFKPTADETWLPVSEVARRLNVSAMTVRRLILNGQKRQYPMLHGQRRGAANWKWYVAESSVTAYLAWCEKKSELPTLLRAAS
jgi:excisionase family DNA binding protein